jgi:hypothetical protein
MIYIISLSCFVLQTYTIITLEFEYKYSAIKKEENAEDGVYIKKINRYTTLRLSLYCYHKG